MENVIRKTFLEKFKSTPQLVKSPGRINLIGEHTDYNDGFVLPASIDKAIYFAIAPNNQNKFRLFAYDLSEYFETETNEIEPVKVQWANFLLGVIAQFVKANKKVPGFDCVFGGDVPLGAGMSSSAAIECGLAFAINTIFDFNFPKLDLVKFSQKAEHEYAGVQCGIMDQFAVMFGKQNQVIKLDCRSLEYEYFPFKMENHLLVLVNTGVKHSLASSEYNIRRAQCEKGVQLLKKYNSSINSLRDVSIEFLENYKSEFDPLIYNRCIFVLKENRRLHYACIALEENNFELFGQYMYGSHKGLKKKYEVSCKELDELVKIAKKTEGVLGARMMGGGFGGCTINLIKRELADSFEQSIKGNYKTPDGKEPEIYRVVIEDGTKELQ
jgi:galactokinase